MLAVVSMLIFAILSEKAGEKFNNEGLREKGAQKRSDAGYGDNNNDY